MSLRWNARTGKKKKKSLSSSSLLFSFLHPGVRKGRGGKGGGEWPTARNSFNLLIASTGKLGWEVKKHEKKRKGGDSCKYGGRPSVWNTPAKRGKKKKDH